ncbi:MAG: hypothetical protein ACRCUM_00420 [Mycoplasmoidaceae bacterium]
MFKIKIKEILNEFEFNGIKIIQTNNPTLLIKNLFSNNSIIEINDKKISINEIIYINELTKFNDLVKLTKNSNIFKLIFDEIDEYPIINYENINKIKEKINNNYFELLENNEGDLSKLILTFFSLLDLGYLNKDSFIFFIKHFFNDKKYTFILDNINWIKNTDIFPFINNHNFIIVTNDFRNYLNNINDFELLYISDEKFNGIDIFEKNSLINYLEKELNIFFDNSLFNEFIKNKTDIEIEKIFFKIKTLKN